MTKKGLLLVSHSYSLVKGLSKLVREVGPDILLTFSGGTNHKDGIGTNYEEILEAINQNQGDEIYALYDLGSAKMKIEMAIEASGKKVKILDTAFVESAFILASLLQVEADDQTIAESLASLKIK
jgi:dihydroxyacetone kinase DhaKLM complex PTS-EIIA-like component DhaM